MTRTIQPEWRYLHTGLSSQNGSPPEIVALFMDASCDNDMTIGREDLIHGYTDSSRLSDNPDIASAQQDLAQLTCHYFLDALLDPESTDYLYVRPIAQDVFSLSFQAASAKALDPAPINYILSQKEVYNIMLHHNLELYKLVDPKRGKKLYDRAFHNIRMLTCIAANYGPESKAKPYWQP